MGSSIRVGVLAVIVLFASAAQAAALETGAFQICGTLKSHQQASATAAGSITVGSRTHEIAPGTALVNAGITVALGTNLCIHGSSDAASGQVVSYTAFGIPANGEVCGNIDGFVPDGTRPLLRIQADFGLMQLWLDDSVARGSVGDRACFRIGIDAAGDAIALERTVVDHPSEHQRISHCGRVNDYAVATASAAGRIRIGSRAYAIAPGTPYTGDPAGDRTDHTAVGQAMCLMGTLGTEGLISYLTRPIHPGIAGMTVEYKPATATEPGLLVLSPTTRFALVIPAGSNFAVDLSRGIHCFAIGLDAVGDAAIERVVECSPVGEAATARNCELVGDPAISERAKHGFLPDQVEITFCGNRRLAEAELEQFMAAESLSLVAVASNAPRTQNAYYFRIASGVTAPDRVRELARNPDVRSVSVVPIGAATTSGEARASHLPSTSVTEDLSTRTDGPPRALAVIGGLAAAAGVLVLLRSGARRGRDSTGSAARPPRD